MKRLHSILAAILAATALAEFAGPVAADDAAGIAREAAAAPPWNRAFTVRDETRKESSPAAFSHTQSIDIPASGKWGVALNFDLKDTTYENMDRMSAGAYFKLSPRIRLGGSVSFGAPNGLRVSTPQDRVLPAAPAEGDSAIRIESSIKF